MTENTKLFKCRLLIEFILVSLSLALFLPKVAFPASSAISASEKFNTPKNYNSNALLDPQLKIWTQNTHNKNSQYEALNRNVIQEKPTVALTLDLCMGKTDNRIFDTLLDQHIPATLFVTKLWLHNKANIETIKKIRKHPELFEIANHGARHLVPVDSKNTHIYGLKNASTIAALCTEVEEGEKAIYEAQLSSQMSDKHWYRGAGAVYSENALKTLNNAGFNIGGFSLNGDYGASLSAQKAFEHISQAKNGDVIIAHMNQPKRAAGAGVARAILNLYEKGYHFIKLSSDSAYTIKPELSLRTWPREKIIYNSPIVTRNSAAKCAISQ